MARQRVPEIIPEFNTYIINTEGRLVAINPVTTNPYWQDFNLTNAEKTEWHDRRGTWSTVLYPAYQNPATSTDIVKHEVANFMKNFNVFAQPLLNKIVASGFADETDEAIFHVVLHRAEPSHRTTPIEDDCIASMEGKGRGLFDIHCKSTTDQSRASIPVDAGANSVQYAYVVAGQGSGPFNPEDQQMRKEISTKAHFQFNPGTQYQGQWLYIYFRWYNTSHPELAGPWSALQVMAIG